MVIYIHATVPYNHTLQLYITTCIVTEHYNSALCWLFNYSVKNAYENRCLGVTNPLNCNVVQVRLTQVFLSAAYQFQG